MKQQTPACIVLAISAAFGAASASAMADEMAADASDVVITDFKGRPPFARTRVSATADVARFEEVASAERAERTDFRGRPPFDRSRVSLDDTDVADFARFEEVSAERPRRSGPPGKMHSRR